MRFNIGYISALWLLRKFFSCITFIIYVIRITTIIYSTAANKSARKNNNKLINCKRGCIRHDIRLIMITTNNALHHGHTLILPHHHDSHYLIAAWLASCHFRLAFLLIMSERMSARSFVVVIFLMIISDPLIIFHQQQ